LVAVPGDRRVDTKSFKKAYGIKDLRLLSPEEVKQQTDLEIGAIPLVHLLAAIKLKA